MTHRSRFFSFQRRREFANPLAFSIPDSTDVWSDRDGTRPTVERVEVDIDRLFAAFDELRTLFALNRADFAELDSLDVPSEELCNDYEAQMFRVSRVGCGTGSSADASARAPSDAGHHWQLCRGG